MRFLEPRTRAPLPDDKKLLVFALTQPDRDTSLGRRAPERRRHERGEHRGAQGPRSRPAARGSTRTAKGFSRCGAQAPLEGWEVGRAGFGETTPPWRRSTRRSRWLRLAMLHGRGRRSGGGRGGARRRGARGPKPKAPLPKPTTRWMESPSPRTSKPGIQATSSSASRRFEWDPSCEIVAGNLEELGVPFAKTVEGETAWFEIAGEKRVRRPRPDRRPVRACAGFRLRPHIELRRARRVRRARTGVRHGSRPANRQDRRSEPGPVARRRQRREPANRNPRDRGPTQDAASSPKSSKRAACPTPARLRAASRRSWSPAQARPPRRAR